MIFVSYLSFNLFSALSLAICLYDQNLQLGFGFCKGDDNFGGGRRKELDDFTLSLGKQMNLVITMMMMFVNVSIVIVIHDQVMMNFEHDRDLSFAICMTVCFLC